MKSAEVYNRPLSSNKRETKTMLTVQLDNELADPLTRLAGLACLFNPTT